MTLHAQSVAPAGNPLDQLPRPQLQPDRPAATPQLDLRPPPGAAAGRMDQQITPRRFDIEGVSALPFDEVSKRFAALAGQPVTLARLVAVAQDVSARYRTLGFPLSFAFLPEQNFADGVVRVVVVEGHIGSIRIEGDAGPSEARLRAIAERLLADRPLRQASFERITQLLARLPGMTVDASAALPGSTDGATALVLKVRREPYNVSLGADLRQPTPRAVLAAVWNDPLWAGGQLSASTLLVEPSRERLLTLGYTQLVGNDGLAVKASISNYRGYPDESLGRGAPLERLNTNRRAELSVAKPLHLDANSSLTLGGGVYAVDNIDDYRVPASGATLSNNTRVRALFGQVAWLEQRADRSRNASVMLARGIDGLGAAADVRSNVPGLVVANPAQLEFTRVSVELGQRDRFANQWGTAATFAAQYSPNTLAPSERVSFGGVRFGRGYAAGDAAGDSGWGLGLEVNRRFAFDMKWLRQVEPYLLLEAAQLSNRLDTPSPSRLRSAALGVRFSDGRHYSLDLALAKPTGDAAASNPARHPRLSLLLSYQLEAR